MEELGLLLNQGCNVGAAKIVRFQQLDNSLDLLDLTLVDFEVLRN